MSDIFYYDLIIMKSFVFGLFNIIGSEHYVFVSVRIYKIYILWVENICCHAMHYGSYRVRIND